MARNIGGESGGAPREIETVEPNVEQNQAPAAEAADLGEPEKKKSKKKFLWIWILIIAVAAVGVTGYFLWDRGMLFFADDQVTIVDTGVIYDGVSVLDIDLSGMTKDEAAPLIQEKAEEKLDAIAMSYTVEDETYELDKDDLGAAIDVDAAVDAAIHYGREGGFVDRNKAIVDAKKNGAEIEVPVSYEQATLEKVISSNKDKLDIEPVDATVEMKPISDEEALTTGMDIVFGDHKVGRKVDEEKLVADLYSAAEAGTYGTIEADVTVLEPEIKREDLDALYTERGTYTTEFESSAYGRRYNIWKMSDIINGVKIEPGETWSINEEAGPRTYDLGWKGAPGISDGEYKEEAGGGICQANSTLYNAVLRAEVEVADRTHHSWPLDYVPGGLDATISTGSPDFKITNNYDVPIFIIAECDAENAKTVKMSIYGPPYEDGLTRDFTSELVDTFGGGGPITVPDSSMTVGQTATIIGEHMGKVFNVYKHYYDADGNEVDKNGNPTDEPELYYVDKYDYKPAKVRVGTAAPAPTPAPAAPAPVAPAAEAPAEVPVAEVPAA